MMNNFNPNETIILENNRARLSTLVFEDIQYLRSIAFEDETLLTYSPSNIHTEEYLQGYLKTALDGKARFVRYPFIIFDKATQQYAGSTSFGNISNKHRRLEIGWTWIGRAFQGTGLNKACKQLLLTYAFETLGFERVEFKADARNMRSRRAMEKIGAKHEGTLKSHTVMADGFRRDTVYYAILKPEWKGLKETIFKSFY